MDSQCLRRGNHHSSEARPLGLVRGPHDRKLLPLRPSLHSHSLPLPLHLGICDRRMIPMRMCRSAATRRTATHSSSSSSSSSSNIHSDRNTSRGEDDTAGVHQIPPRDLRVALTGGGNPILVRARAHGRARPIAPPPPPVQPRTMAPRRQPSASRLYHACMSCWIRVAASTRRAPVEGRRTFQQLSLPCRVRPQCNSNGRMQQLLLQCMCTCTSTPLPPHSALISSSGSILSMALPAEAEEGK